MSFSRYLLKNVGVPFLQGLGGILILCLIMFFCLPFLWFPAWVEIAQYSAIAGWAIGIFFFGGWFLITYIDYRIEKS